MLEPVLTSNFIYVCKYKINNLLRSFSLVPDPLKKTALLQICSI